MRRRDPRRLLARRREARARVRLLHVPQPAGPGIGSRQVAEVTLPRAAVDRIWTPEHLERLARTYWLFLSKVSLGILRVLYTESSREVVVLTRPFVLLRFRPPEYRAVPGGGSVTWPIDRGLLVARDGRGRGYLRLTAHRAAPHDGAAEVTVTVSSEVVSFYPMIAARIGRWLYNQTQLRLHVIVTHAFLRSLVNLELPPSAVGRFASPSARPRFLAASRGRGEP